MAVQASLIVVPSDGSEVMVVSGQAINTNQVGVRNTGSVAVLLGPPGACVFPFLPMEFYGVEVAGDDNLHAVVATPGTAGELAALAMG